MSFSHKSFATFSSDAEFNTDSLARSQLVDKNIDSILILERSLERSGQQWIENLNVIEQYLVEIVEIIGQRQPLLKSNFILRRLPMYSTSFTNKNEYAIVLANIDFTLLSPRRNSTADGNSTINFGQIEVFHKAKEAPAPKTQVCIHGREIHTKTSDTQNFWNEILNDNNALCSHEIFKKFASAFVRASNPDPDYDEVLLKKNPTNSKPASPDKNPTVANVQLISPHLLHDMLTNKEVEKIFTLTSERKLNTDQGKTSKKSNGRTSKTDKCRISINYLKSLLTISLEDTEIVVKPCLFLDKGYARVNSNLLDRIPLFHTNILNICDALGKGCLLFPTSFDTLWTLQFWPCESHLICTYHPSSIISRIFKLYSAFCLHPAHFWESLNNCFLVGTDDMVDSVRDKSFQNFTIEFLLSTFLHEMEKFSSIEDWAPRNLYKRFIHVLNSSVDSYEKGFSSHYFTKINILRGMWKDSIEHFGREESSALKALDDIEEFPEDGTDYGEKSVDYLDNDNDEDYGLHFDTLTTTEDSDTFLHFDVNAPLTSDTVYKTVNPFQSMEMLPGTSNGSSSAKAKSVDSKQRKFVSLSRIFGANFLRRFIQLKRNRSDVHEHSKSQARKGKGKGRASGTGTTKSMEDVMSGFAEAVGQNRREETIKRHLKTVNSTDYEASLDVFTDDDDPTDLNPSNIHVNNHKGRRGRSYSVPTAEPRSDRKSQTNQHQHHSNSNGTEIQKLGVKKPSESIYSYILQILNEIPPSDHLSDVEVIQELEVLRKILLSQDELITEWSNIMKDFTTPKLVCPHTFSLRQIHYISKIIQKISKCSPTAINTTTTSSSDSMKIQEWEISGDLLRTVLHQMRSEPVLCDTIKEKQKVLPIIKRLSLKTFKSTIGVHEDKQSKSSGSALKKLSFKRQSSDGCTGAGHGNHNQSVGGHLTPDKPDSDVDAEVDFSMEEPEMIATSRLLDWLWQLRTSNVGRLSNRAKKYLEFLYLASLHGAHFIEQFSQEQIFQSMAIRSAVAVSKIMADDKLPGYAPLLAASKKGWLWAEMVLSLASWNKEKGFSIQADVPDPKNISNSILRDIAMPGEIIGNTLKKIKDSEPDTEAVTLAFHSELATPLGWNDFEDPRRPGPFTVAILIFSSLGYFKQWEMIPGNVVQVMVRLQKFHNLQRVGTLLFPPHRKTALNEVRKLNKSLSFRTYQFDDKVMSKTFKRLASLRSTRKMFNSVPNANRRVEITTTTKYLSCQEMGCTTDRSVETEISFHDGKEFECTKL